MTPEAARPPTIKTIAQNVGMTANTVSRALRGSGSISPTTRDKILAEARRLGYVPNAAARALVLGSANSLGLVMTNPSNPFYSELFSVVERRSRKDGYMLHLAATEENLQNEESAVDAMLRWRVDGAIVVSSQGSDAPWQRLMANGVPMICVNRPLLEVDCELVGIDYEQGAYDATVHMLDSGHWPLVVFEEDLEITTVHSRIAGVHRACVARGRAPEDVSIVRIESPRENNSTLPWQPQSAYAEARRRLAHIPRGTGVIAGNDFLALGVYRAANELGLSMPEDLGVCGQGDHPFSAFLNPGLTTVRAPVQEIGAAAVDWIIQRVRTGSDHAPAHRRFAPELQVRGSTMTVNR
ncbi:LacI family DNA-binding transcriptional regulator [Ruania zhangjianzhongii]|uniref:LacI family DNA-binding transcriptional regulator n=1 Tax=Ruania zhangjianzhongii TaxID=2603206 RepID=UPI0011C89F26|nr:LacI family DNA-binding transcriptional regulator [Ruania zhangjianzhongii]